ncbi:5-hydroxytryptamine receptor 1A-alpha-like [Anneissia japonica]|uniref:5-hydroxytryptamine receptor 1A-alpha-like n=1 Tax=Anneissia japonica TaxID=1529436 RepID=UPI00142589DF|nr:5-hydroxytryptamine receptor 1A-alpha-like [Anneissia japonica]
MATAYCMMELNSTDQELEYNSIAMVFQSGLMLFIILSGLIGNAITLYALKINTVFHTKSYVFIANLAVADLLNCLLGMPVILVSSILNEWVFGEALCNIMGGTTVLFCSTSLLTLCAISVERYVCITDPFKYDMKLTENRLKFVVCWTWFQAFIFAVLPITGWSTYVYISNEFICTVDWGNHESYTITLFICCIGVPFVSMMYAYLNILKVARAQLRKVAALDFAQPSNAKTKLRKETKAAFTLLIVIGTFFICWIPHVISMACLMFENCPLPDWYFTTTTWLAMANSACNPVIYGILNKTFRTTCMSILRRRFQTQSRIFSMTAKPEISRANNHNIVHHISSIP